MPISLKAYNILNFNRKFKSHFSIGRLSDPKIVVEHYQIFSKLNNLMEIKVIQFNPFQSMPPEYMSTPV